MAADLHLGWLEVGLTARRDRFGDLLAVPLALHLGVGPPEHRASPSGGEVAD
jgi:hypothetical protein